MRSIVGLGLALVLGCGAATRPAPVTVTHRPMMRAPVEIGRASVETQAASIDTASRAVPPTVEVAVAAGRHWRLDTARGPVHVWTPAGYDRATAMTIVYVHGYFIDLDRAWSDHRLPAQFARSGLNAMFVACGAPETYGEPVVWASLDELLGAVETGTHEGRPGGRIVAVGHSAAWRTLTAWVHEDVLDTLVLFDAAYEVPQFLAWINRSSDHRLIDVGDDTRPWTDALHRALPDTIVVEDMPAPGDDVPTDARILYIRSEVGHMPLVTGGVALPIVLEALTGERVRGAPAWETRAAETP